MSPLTSAGWVPSDKLRAALHKAQHEPAFDDDDHFADLWTAMREELGGRRAARTSAATVTRWWSASQKRWMPLADMNDFHLRAALAKLQRGDASAPLEDGGESVPLLASEAATCEVAFRREFARRGLDENGNLRDATDQEP